MQKNAGNYFRMQQNLYTMLFVIDSIIYLCMVFLIGIWEAFSDM